MPFLFKPGSGSAAIS